MFLLITLLPLLGADVKSKGPGRVSFVSSVMSWDGKLPSTTPMLPAFDNKSNFGPVQRYNDSKLLAQLFIDKLAETVPAEDVVINMVEPGLVDSAMGQDIKGAVSAVLKLVKKLFGRSMEQGGLTYIDAAVVKGPETRGSFIANCTIVPLAPIATQPEGSNVIQQLWDETLDELSFAGATEILASFNRA